MPKRNQATLQKKQKTKINEMETYQGRVAQQAVDRDMRAARREENRNKGQADDINASVLLRQSSAPVTEVETKKKCSDQKMELH